MWRKSFRKSLRKSFQLTLSLFSLVGALLITSCFGPETEAERLLAEAAQLVDAAEQAQQTSFTNALQLYQAALAKAEAAIRDASYAASQEDDLHSEADLAIGPTTLRTLRDTIIPRLQRQAEAENSPLACAFLVARTIPETQPRMDVLEQISQGYIEAQQYERALQVAERIEDEHSKAQILKTLVLKDVQAGRYEQGVRRALRIAKLTTQELFGIEVLTEIAVRYVEADQYDWALQVAKTAQRPAATAWVMTEIARRRASEGDNTDDTTDAANSVDILSQASQVAQDIPKASLKSLVFGQIGRVYAQLGFYDRALQLIQAMQDVHEQDIQHQTDLLLTVAHTAIEAGSYDTVQHIAQGMALREGTDETGPVLPGLLLDSFSRTQVLIGIAEKYAQTGEQQRALEILSKAQQSTANITDSSRQAQSLGQIARTTLEAGAASQALKLAQAINEPAQRANVLLQLALSHIGAGEIDQALHITTLLSAAGDTNDRTRQAEIFGHIALAYLEQGKAEQALRFAQQIELSGQRTETFVQLALSHLDMAEQDMAEIDRALHIATTLGDNPQQADVMGRIAVAYLEQGDAERALQLADSIERPQQRMQAVARLAHSYAQAGDIDQALRLSTTLTDSSQHAQLLERIALAYIKQGDVGQAQQLAQTIELPEQKTQALVAIAFQLAKAGEADQALQTATSIPHPPRKEAALLSIARTYLHANRYDHALKAVRSMYDAPSKAEVLARLARTYAESGHQEQSAALLTQALSIAKTRSNTSAKAQTLALVGFWHPQGNQTIAEKAKTVLHDIIVELGERRSEID